jgi:hypothetical protein
MTHLDTAYVGLYMSALKDTNWSLNNYFDSQIFGRIIIFFIRLIQSVEDSPNFPESVIIVSLSVNFCIVVCKVKEAKNMEKSVAFLMLL